ncbi:MAG: hypothetical protein AAGK97_15270, partial [Bacteroidota bacterium]
VNFAEIAYTEDTTGAPRFDDVDSSPDSDNTNDAGGNPGTASDDVVNGDGTGMPGDEDPLTDEDDHDPAYVAVPIIDLEKSLISLVPAASGIDGNFDATFELQSVNTGNIKLTNIKLQDDLVEQLGPAFVGITSPPEIVPPTDAAVEPTVQTSYNGGVQDSIFNGTDGCMDPGDTLTVQMTIEIVGTGPNPPINEATVMGTDTLGNMVMDTDTAVIEVPDCALMVNCPNPDQGVFECPTDIPEFDNTVAHFNAIDGFSAIVNACGIPQIDTSSTTNGGTGCGTDTLIITRRYIISDTVKLNGVPLDTNGVILVEMDTCEITYYLVDDENPVVICPGPFHADCSSDEIPVYTTIDEFTAAGGFVSDNCGVESFSLMSEVSDGETCPETVTRTYEVLDSCNNSSTCVIQIFVNDQVGPEISCLP